MGAVTITLNDDKKLDELLTLVTALPYVERAQVEGLTAEKPNGPGDCRLLNMKVGLLAHHLGE